MLHTLILRLLCAAAPAMFDVACAPVATEAEPPPVEWHQVPWRGGTLNVALVRPLGEGNEAPHPVILALPWGTGSAELVETFIQSYWITHPMIRGYYVVAPEVRGSTLASTAEEVVPAIFSWMDEELRYDPGRVALVGASNGGRGIFFAARAQPDRFQALVGLPGQYEGPAQDLEALRDKPVWLLVGERDRAWVTGATRTLAALDSVGARATLDIVPGEGHVMRLNASALLDWIDEALGR